MATKKIFLSSKTYNLSRYLKNIQDNAVIQLTLFIFFRQGVYKCKALLNQMIIIELII